MLTVTTVFDPETRVLSYKEGSDRWAGTTEDNHSAQIVVEGIEALLEEYTAELVFGIPMYNNGVIYHPIGQIDAETQTYVLPNAILASARDGILPTELRLTKDSKVITSRNRLEISVVTAIDALRPFDGAYLPEIMGRSQEWAPDVQYAKGAIVIRDEVLYYSGRADNLGHDPKDGNISWWREVSVVAIQEYQTYIGDGVSTQFTIAHHMLSPDLQFTVSHNGTDLTGDVTDMTAIDENTASFTFSSPPPADTLLRINEAYRAISSPMWVWGMLESEEGMVAPEALFGMLEITDEKVTVRNGELGVNSSGRAYAGPEGLTKVLAKEEDLDAHVTRTDNPHNVTKEQLGLQNVDPTSDLNKPISNATQAALDLKADITEGVEQWSPDITYSSGAISNIGGTLYASLISNNKGNYPVSSPHWIKYAVDGGGQDPPPQSSVYVTTVGDGTSTEITVTHSLNSEDVMTELYSLTGEKLTIDSTIIRANVNQVTLRFSTAPAANSVRVLISKPGTSVRTVNGLHGDVVLDYDDVGAVEANPAIASGTKCKISFDGKGLVTGGADLSGADIPAHSADLLTSGTVADERITHAVERIYRKTSVWTPVPSDNRYPTEKLVKESLALKADITEGVEQWSADVVYSSGAITNVGGTLYASLVSNNENNDPDLSPDKWMKYTASSASDPALQDAYVTTIGDGVSTSITVTHSLDSEDVIVSLYSMAGDKPTIDSYVVRDNENQITIQFSVAPASNSVRVMVSRPGTSVRSVNGYQGDVILDPDDIGAVSSNHPITAGTKTKISYDTQGLVTVGEDLLASDIPNLNASKITAGTFDVARIPISKFVWTITGDGVTDEFTAAHLLGGSPLLIQMADSAGRIVDAAMEATATDLSVSMTTPPAVGTTYSITAIRW